MPTNQYKHRSVLRTSVHPLNVISNAKAYASAYLGKIWFPIKFIIFLSIILQE